MKNHPPTPKEIAEAKAKARRIAREAIPDLEKAMREILADPKTGPRNRLKAQVLLKRMGR